jgi:hypothetical protein
MLRCYLRTALISGFYLPRRFEDHAFRDRYELQPGPKSCNARNSLYRDVPSNCEGAAEVQWFSILENHLHG